MCENIFTQKEVEAILKLTPNTVSNLIGSKELEHFKIRGKIRVSETQLDCFLDANRVTAASEKNQMAAN